MDPTDSIEDLIEQLNKANKQEVPKILKNLQLKKTDLDQYATWCDADYTRNCIMRTAGYELILICWDAKACTPIHDHGGQDCWVYQAVGDLTEIRYQKLNEELSETDRMVLQPGGLTYMSDEMGYHQLCNEAGSRSYTLHLYASPIDSCEVFNDETNSFETKEMCYDTCPEEVTID